MKIATALLGLILVSVMASALPTVEKLIPGQVSLWNLAQSNQGVHSTLYITGDAAKEIFENLTVQESGLGDEYGHPTGSNMKAGKNVVCTKDVYAQYRCSLNFDGRTGALK